MSMFRHATIASGGRANLSAGAIGIGIDMETGRFTTAYLEAEDRFLTLSELGIDDAYVIPKWDETKAIAKKIAEADDLCYNGVDIVLDQNDNAMVLEINGRPGIGIQNVNQRSILSTIHAMNKNSSNNTSSVDTLRFVIG
jgi:hypothetical protein